MRVSNNKRRNYLVNNKNSKKQLIIRYWIDLLYFECFDSLWSPPQQE